jgi:hypothetical protein
LTPWESYFDQKLFVKNMVVVTEQISISVQSLKNAELTEGVVVTE